MSHRQNSFTPLHPESPSLQPGDEWQVGNISLEKPRPVRKSFSNGARSLGRGVTGFTLIEVLLALFITAILTTILAVVFNTGLRAYRQGKDLIEITRKAQLILGQMTREISGAMVQSVGATTYIPFVGNRNSVYFMAPVDNSSDVDLCEIGYNLVSPILKRHFLTVDAESGYEYPDKVDYGENEVTFCENVTAFDLRYHDGSGWKTTYPWSPDSNLPTMVEVSVTIQGEYPKNAPKQSKTFTTWIYLPNSTNNP